jgi:hypothetical protein
VWRIWSGSLSGTRSLPLCLERTWLVMSSTLPRCLQSSMGQSTEVLEREDEDEEEEGGVLSESEG